MFPRTRLNHGSGSRKGNTVMLQAYADRYFKEIVILLGAIPSELLLLFKTGDCLRHLDKQLGTPINTSAGQRTFFGLC